MAPESSYQPSPSQHVREQVELYERSGGQEGNLLDGRPVVIITSRGARSGALRKTPLMRVEHDGAYLAVASMGGAPQHPQWYYNVSADPRVRLQDGAERSDLVARELSGEERRQWWARAVEAFPPYAEYQERTEREIPIFLLEG